MKYLYLILCGLITLSGQLTAVPPTSSQLFALSEFDTIIAMEEQEEPYEERYLVEIIGDTPNYQRFAELLETAGLADILVNEQYFTLLVPTNEAFENASTELLAKLTNGEAPEQLQELLMRHIIPKEIRSMKLGNTPFQTLGGQNLVVNIESVPGEKEYATNQTLFRVDLNQNSSESLFLVKNMPKPKPKSEPVITIHNVRVIRTDIVAKNGVIHEVDGIILP